MDETEGEIHIGRRPREKVRDALARRRGMSPASIPDWYELDDADYVDLLNEIRDGDAEENDDVRDPRM